MGKAVLTMMLAAVAFLLAAAAEAPRDLDGLLSGYARRFNATDTEHYANAIPNAAAENFMLENCPRFACPDEDVERTYYFRWWTFRKHLRQGADGRWLITEFLPKVPWSGKENTIVCPAGHHLREARWLRDGRYAADTARFWLADPEATHRWRYSSWLYTGTRQAAEVSGDEKLSSELLDAAVSYWERWEKGFRYERNLPMGGDGKGGFLSIDNHEGTEISLGGNGYKPLFTSAMWSEAKALAEEAAKQGRKGLAEKFAAKAEAVRQSLFGKCWNPELGFFTTATEAGKKGEVRELHGYAPWYFGVPVEGREADWSQLGDVRGFAAKCGLSFPERRAKGFTIDYKGHECKWNGPSWPFATSVALTAFANDLQSRGETEGAKADLYAALVRQYARQHQRQTDPKLEGCSRIVPWIDENCHPDKLEWISRKIILENEGMRKRFPEERGKDYNHSTYCDLVITGLAGFVPEGAEGFSVKPLFPAEWDYLTLDRLRYRGREVSIRWRRGQGLEVAVDGKTAARRATHGALKVRFPGLSAKR